MTPAELLSPQKALIFRVTHFDNLQWILKNGLHCSSSEVRDPGFVPIGKTSLIAGRDRTVVPVPPFGCLSDYIPFYFTPWSPMLLNIVSGHQGVAKVAPERLVFMVADWREIHASANTTIFTDIHAYQRFARFFSDPRSLHEIDWATLRRRDRFGRPDVTREPDRDPGKLLRIEAEALVHRHLPIRFVKGFGCFNENSKRAVDKALETEGIRSHAVVRREWFFR